MSKGHMLVNMKIDMGPSESHTKSDNFKNFHYGPKFLASYEQICAFCYIHCKFSNGRKEKDACGL